MGLGQFHTPEIPVFLLIDVIFGNYSAAESAKNVLLIITLHRKCLVCSDRMEHQALLGKAASTGAHLLVDIKIHHQLDKAH